MQNDPDTTSYISSKGITWKFIPEYAPWQGGFYERMVGLIKANLKKAIGRCLLDYDQLNTLVTEVECVINSRPLTYIG